MNILKYLLGAVALIAAVGCVAEDEAKEYPTITNLSNTLWENRSEDKSGNFYLNTLSFDSEERGVFTSYDTDNLQQPLESCLFTYSYPLNERWGLTITFDDSTTPNSMAGRRYDGYIVQKGNIQVDFKDVYVIQLFEVDSEGNTILNDKNEPASSMTFWKE